MSAGLSRASLIAAGFTRIGSALVWGAYVRGRGCRLSVLSAAFTDEVVGGRCTHRPPAQAPVDPTGLDFHIRFTLDRS